MGLATFAVRHPKRPEAHRLASIQEDEYSSEVKYPNGEDGGISVHHTILKGPFPSATRAEAYGILNALRAPYPVNNGSDNKGAVAIVQSILNGTQGTKPWAMRNHGDIYEIIETTLRERGFSSAAITWLKGHALQTEKGRKAIEQGILSKEEALLHEQVDEDASSMKLGAQRLHGLMLHQYAQVQAKRDREYKEMVKII
jgi:hypothetical protein